MRKVVLPFAAALLAASPAAAQMMTPGASASSTSFSVTLTEPVGPGGEAAARAKIYEAANNECKTAAKAFGKQCRIGTMSIQSVGGAAPMAGAPMPNGAGQAASAAPTAVQGILTLILE